MQIVIANIGLSTTMMVSETHFEGRITASPKNREPISILGLTIYQVMARPADGGWGDHRFPKVAGRTKLRTTNWFSRSRDMPLDNSAIRCMKAATPPIPITSEGNPH